MTTPQVSVVIPTYHRADQLRAALASLDGQSLEKFQAIVVDNGADGCVRTAVDEHNTSARHPVEYVAEPRLGLHHARHAGARAATGDVLVFTDDDATFDPGWLAAYAAAFQDHPRMAASGGPVRPAWQSTPPRWLLEELRGRPSFGILSLMEPYAEFRLDQRGYFYGVNMAIRRQVLFEVGGFNPESFGSLWLGDGETGLIRKLRLRSMLVGYVPAAGVFHHIPPERLSLDYFCRRLANQGACDIYSLYHDGIPGRLRLLWRAGRLAKRNVACWARAPFLSDPADPTSRTIRLVAAHTWRQFELTIRLILDHRYRKWVTAEESLHAGGGRS